MPEENHLASRVSSLETSTPALRLDIADLRRALEEFAKTTREALGAIRTTNWNTLMSAVGLTVLIIGGLGALYVAPLYGAIAKVSAIDDLHRAYIEKASLKDSARVEALEKQLSEAVAEIRVLSERCRQMDGRGAAGK
jgi:hypothetical protein